MEEQVNLNMFNDSELIANATSRQLEQLAAISVNAEQLDKVAHANNVNSKVVTAILNNNKADLVDLTNDNILKLVKLCGTTEELMKIMRVINAGLARSI